MTLTEYINQDNPQYMPTVFLCQGEYITGQSYVRRRGTVSEETLTQVWVNGFDHEYIEINGKLYTSDGHGNPVKLSVFRIT